MAGIALSLIDISLFGTTTTEPGSIEGSTNFAPLSSLFSLVTFLPSISVTVRRLHDRDKSGWWYWLALVPLIGWVILIVWFCIEGTRGDNRYGADPLA